MPDPTKVDQVIILAALSGYARSAHGLIERAQALVKLRRSGQDTGDAFNELVDSIAARDQEELTGTALMLAYTAAIAIDRYDQLAGATKALIGAGSAAIPHHEVLDHPLDRNRSRDWERAVQQAVERIEESGRKTQGGS